MKRILTIMTTGLLVMGLSVGAAWAKTGISNIEQVRSGVRAIEAYEDQQKATLEGKYTVKVYLKDIANHWASVPIKRVAGMWLFTGYDDGTFRPNSYISQAEMITLIMRLVDNDNVSAAMNSAKLNEVPVWARDSVNKAVYSNILSLARFQPTQQATRAQTCVTVAKALKLAPIDNANAHFADRSLINQDALKYIMAMLEAGYINGGKDNYFLPESGITRAEMATIMDRVLDDLNRDSSEEDIVNPPNQENNLPDNNDHTEAKPEISME